MGGISNQEQRAILRYDPLSCQDLLVPCDSSR